MGVLFMADLNIVLTNHVKERYAERIIGKDTKSDIAVFIAQNEDKIYNDISNMIKYGELIFEGTQVDSKNVKVYRKDTWMVILDSKTNAVITLYKIELGAGPELDKLYVEKMLEKLIECQEEEKKAQEEVENDTKDYKTIISDMEIQIAEYRKAIKEMEALVSNYKETIQNSNARLIKVKENTANVLNKLLSKKHF